MTTGTIKAKIKNAPMLINGKPYTIDEVYITMSIIGIKLSECYDGSYDVDDFELDEVLSIDDYETDIEEDIVSEELLEDKINWNDMNQVKLDYMSIELDDTYDYFEYDED